MIIVFFDVLNWYIQLMRRTLQTVIIPCSNLICSNSCVSPSGEDWLSGAYMYAIGKLQ
jgi:hypothetical protein